MRKPVQFQWPKRPSCCNTFRRCQQILFAYKFQWPKRPGCCNSNRNLRPEFNVLQRVSAALRATAHISTRHHPFRAVNQAKYLI